MNARASALDLRDALAALRQAPQHSAAIEAGLTEKIVERVRVSISETLERQPVVAIAVAGETALLPTVPGGAAWTIAGDSNRAVIAMDAPALAIVVAQMFGAPAATVVETPVLPPRPLEKRLAAVVAGIVVAAIGAIACEGASLRLGQLISSEAGHSGDDDLPLRLTISLSAYGAGGAITVRAAAPFGAAGKEAAVDNRARTAWTDGIARAVAGIGVPARVVIAMPRSTLGEIARWRPGDIIALPGSGALVATVMAGARPLAVGELGRDGRQYCVRVAGFSPPAKPIGAGHTTPPSGVDEA